MQIKVSENVVSRVFCVSSELKKTLLALNIKKKGAARGARYLQPG